MIIILIAISVKTYGQTGTVLTLDESTITATLNRFNEIRRSVSPPASNMQELMRRV